jgi:hypothetical protein
MAVVATAIAGFLGGGATAVWIGSAAVRLLTSVALGAIASLLTKNSQNNRVPGGIRTSVTQNGGTNPTSFVLGKFATAGYHITPPMSHGTAGTTPNAFLTYVIELTDIRRAAVTRMMIDGEYITLSAGVDADGFYTETGKYAGKFWVKFYDGTQTVADPWLLTTYGSYTARPWTSDMIGRDQCYAIVRFQFSETLYNGFPQVRFETSGIPLYDPRSDTTVGGSGAQRWADPTTWVASNNPMVQAYNIFRGISFADGTVWGGGVPADDLPLTEWFAAMNACDATVSVLGGGTEAAYRSGLEVLSNDEPMTILEELEKASSGQFVDMGGIWKPKVGSVGLPVLFLTDDDVIVTKPQEFDPFPNLSDTFNGVSASYPEPVSLYESVSAPIRTSATDETADGGRRLIADIAFAAVPYKDQVQRLMEAYRLDNRRFRRHALTLGPTALLLEPTDSVSWTSAANGYTAKIFEANSVTDDLMTALQRVALRERDSADYSWNAATDTKPTSPVPGTVVPPSAQTVTSWAVTAISLTGDVVGVALPALKLTWDGANKDGVEAIKFQVRLASSGVTFIRASTHDVEAGEYVVADGIAGSTTYEVRARFVNKSVSTVWTSWTSATTGTATYVPSTGTFLDTGFTLQDNVDLTKQVKFELADVPASTLVTVTAPALSGKMVVTATGEVAAGDLADIATDSLIGRDTAGTGAPEVISVGGGLVFNGSGTLRTAAFTGDVTKAAGGTVQTIAANVVDNTKAAQMAANTIKGNNTGALANAADLSVSSVKAMLAYTAADISGLGALATLSNVGTTELTNLSVTTAKLADNGVINGKLAQMPAVTVKANITASTANAADVTLPLALGAMEGFTTTVTAAGTTTLTATSTKNQIFTGTTTQTVVFPTAGAVVPGLTYHIVNQSTGALTVNASNAALIATIPAGQTYDIICNTTSGGGPAAWTSVPVASGGSGSPGGSTTQVQYNNAGAFAGATEVEIEGNQLRLEATTSLTTPAAGGVKLIGQADAGLTVPAWLNAAGKAFQLQDAISRNHAWFCKAQAAQGTFSTMGGTAPTTIGTATAFTVTTTNLVSRMSRLEYLVTVASTSAIAGYRQTQPIVTCGGAAAGEGGFTFVTRWGPATGVATTTNRAFCGLRAATGVPTDVEPSTLVSCVGMGWDAADTNIQMMHNDASGTCTKVDLGGSFAVPTTDRDVIYELALYSPKGTTQSVEYRVTNLVSGAVASGTINTNLPTTTTLLAASNWMSVGGTSSVIGIGVASIYLDPLI